MTVPTEFIKLFQQQQQHQHRQAAQQSPCHFIHSNLHQLAAAQYTYGVVTWRPWVAGALTGSANHEQSSSIRSHQNQPESYTYMFNTQFQTTWAPEQVATQGAKKKERQEKYVKPRDIPRPKCSICSNKSENEERAKNNIILKPITHDGSRLGAGA